MKLIEQLIISALESSNIAPQGNKPRLVTPVRLWGDGQVIIGRNVQFGTIKGPDLISISQIVCINSGKVIIDDDCIFNNNFYLLADGAQISIGKNGKFGPRLTIMTRNQHQLDPKKRHLKDVGLPINVGAHVFTGIDVLILKGSNIPDGAVVPARAVVDRRSNFTN